MECVVMAADASKEPVPSERAAGLGMQDSSFATEVLF